MTRDEQIAYWTRNPTGTQLSCAASLKIGITPGRSLSAIWFFEKLLKALYVKKYRLAGAAHAQPAQDSKDLRFADVRRTRGFFLGGDDIQYQTRYPDFKKSFQRKANEEFTLERVARIEEMQKWLKKILAG